jgi:negative regulator of flagellin synthesis FlgM
MKITNNPTPNPYQNDTMVETTKGSQKAGKTQGFESVLSQSGTANRTGADVEISDNAKLMRQASDIAKSTTDNRKEKIAALKKSIQEGSYQVDAKEIADRLVEEHLNADFGKNNL